MPSTASCGLTTIWSRCPPWRRLSTAGSRSRRFLPLRNLDAIVHADDSRPPRFSAGKRRPARHDAASARAPGPTKSLRDQVITIFLAGYETVANALTWTWYLLSQNPDCERRFHEEIDRELLGRLPAYEDLPRLRYVEMVMAESMRLYPPAWAMGRYALNDFQLGDFFLACQDYGSDEPVHHAPGPTLLSGPLRFDPERFTPEAKARRAKFTYFPFGAGFRQCIGESFAWMEGVLLLATLGQQWKLHLRPGHNVRAGASHSASQIRHADADREKEMNIYLIDGTYELFRHYFAVPSASDVTGQEIAAVRGVLNSVSFPDRKRRHPSWRRDRPCCGVIPQPSLSRIQNQRRRGPGTAFAIPYS